MSKVLLVSFLFFTSFAFAQEPNWSVNPSAYEHSMTLTTVVINQNENYSSEEILIGVFDGQECVGVSTTDTPFPPINAKFGFCSHLRERCLS